jgi:acetyl esterase/lipase
LLLLYPCLHPVIPPPSAELAGKLAEAQLATPREVADSFVENYLGAPIAAATPYAMPGLADDLRGLPPTLIINCEFDPLRASGEVFAHALAQADVEVDCRMAPGVVHGHINTPSLPQAHESYAEMAGWITTR